MFATAPLRRRILPLWNNSAKEEKLWSSSPQLASVKKKVRRSPAPLARSPPAQVDCRLEPAEAQALYQYDRSLHQWSSRGDRQPSSSSPLARSCASASHTSPGASQRPSSAPPKRASLPKSKLKTPVRDSGRSPWLLADLRDEDKASHKPLEDELEEIRKGFRRFLPSGSRT
eukprot:751802-Hanusia_phi.AAC.6